MSKVKTSVVLSVRKALRTLYTPKIRAIAEFIGVSDVLHTIYKRVNIQDDIEFHVRGASITVETRGVRERRGVEEYQGAERPVIEDLLTNLRPTDVFYDIGAWIGTYSCLVAVAQPSVVVYAFEPGAERFNRLRQTIARNDVDINTHQIALSTEDQTLTLSSGGQLTTESGDGETVDVVDADEFVTRQAIDPPTVVKIDVEGKELDVIRGLKNTLENPNCRLLYCEAHPQNGVDVEELCGLLRSLGFSTTELHNRKEVKFIKAEKRDHS